MSRRRIQVRMIILMVTFCIAVAISTYALLTALTPAIRSATTNPHNNTTTRTLADTADSPRRAWLYIPKIDVSVPIGTSENALLKGVWWRKPANGNPRDGGNFVLAGHRFIMDFTPAGTAKKSPFYSIDKLGTGDTIVVDYQGVRYTYVVSEKRTVTPTTVSIEARTKSLQLTLYSCTLAGSQDGRDVIIATPQ